MKSLWGWEMFYLLISPKQDLLLILFSKADLLLILTLLQCLLQTMDNNNIATLYPLPHWDLSHSHDNWPWTWSLESKCTSMKIDKMLIWWWQEVPGKLFPSSALTLALYSILSLLDKGKPIRTSLAGSFSSLSSLLFNTTSNKRGKNVFQSKL